MEGFQLPSRKKQFSMEVSNNTLYTDSILMKSWIHEFIVDLCQRNQKSNFWGKTVVSKNRNVNENSKYLWEIRHDPFLQSFKILKYIQVGSNKVIALVRDLQNKCFFEFSQDCISDFELKTGLRITMLSKSSSSMIHTSDLIDDVILKMDPTIGKNHTKLEWRYHSELFPKTKSNESNWKLDQDLLAECFSDSSASHESEHFHVKYPVLIVNKISVASIETCRLSNIATKLKHTHNGVNAMSFEDYMYLDRKSYPLLHTKEKVTQNIVL